MLHTALPPPTHGRHKSFAVGIPSKPSIIKLIIALTLALALCIFMFRAPVKVKALLPSATSVLKSQPNNASPETLPKAPLKKPKQNTEASKLYIEERPWNGDRPRWCADLIANPVEQSKKVSFYGCKRDRFGAICDDGVPRFFSSSNQDIWTWTQHWKYLERPGVYVDIAANEPVRTSNTYFLDVCMKWRGLCVEANPKYHTLLTKLRSCGLMPTCVSDKRETVTFLMDEALSGISSTNKNKKMKKDKASTLTCVPTSQAIDASGMYDIDMLSLDVEGHEYKVLQGIDWKRTRINVILIETVTRGSATILKREGYRRFVVKGGYRKSNIIFGDSVFVHRRVVWGKPV